MKTPNYIDILIKVYSCKDDNSCAEHCSYCRLKRCLLSGMNIAGVFKTGLGKGRKIGPTEYTAEQIEKMLATGNLFESEEFDEKSNSDESSDETITDPCQARLSI